MLTQRQYRRLWAQATALVIPSRLGKPASRGAVRRARRAELRLRACEWAWIVERYPEYRRALDEGTCSVRDLAPVPYRHLFAEMLEDAR
jgi:hypothetical protein